jgi:hypothetical protein
MKILQIIPSVSLVYGGPSQMVLGLSAALATEGIDVTIISTNSNGDAGQPPLDVPIGKPIAQNGYQIVYFPCSPFRRYKFSFDLLRWLAIYARQYDLAHIHALFSPVCTAAATVARSQKLPYILRPLGTLDPADLQKKRQLKQLYGYLLERPNLAGSAAIHFTSKEECKISERYSHSFRGKRSRKIAKFGTNKRKIGNKKRYSFTLIYVSHRSQKRLRFTHSRFGEAFTSRISVSFCFSGNQSSRS